MEEAKYVRQKNMFWYTLTVKSMGRKIEFLHCSFEGKADNAPSNSALFSLLDFCHQSRSKYIFPENFFAPTISGPEFTVRSVTLKKCKMLAPVAQLRDKNMHMCQKPG